MAEQLTWSTEQRNPRTADIDTWPSGRVVEQILTEDQAVAGAVLAQSETITRAVDAAVAAIAAGGRVHYVGSGTSGRLGVLDAAELLPTYGVADDVVVAHLAGGPEAMTRAAEGAEDDPVAGAAVAEAAGPHDVIVGIAASGRTPYVGGALEAARRRGLTTVLVSSNPAAPLAAHADIAVLVDSGPESVTGSTRMKAATAQKLVLNTFSTATMIRLGKTLSNLMIDVVATNDKLRKRSVHMLEQATGAPADACRETLEAAGGRLRVAVVALLADAPIAEAEAALARFGPDPARAGDPSGIRSAVASLG